MARREPSGLGAEPSSHLSTYRLPPAQEGRYQTRDLRRDLCASTGRRNGGLGPWPAPHPLPPSASLITPFSITRSPHEGGASCSTSSSVTTRPRSQGAAAGRPEQWSCRASQVSLWIPIGRIRVAYVGFAPMSGPLSTRTARYASVTFGGSPGAGTASGERPGPRSPAVGLEA
jgi:hypothetical protein